jgi:hypothetical protein
MDSTAQYQIAVQNAYQAETEINGEQEVPGSAEIDSNPGQHGRGTPVEYSYGDIAFKQGEQSIDKHKHAAYDKNQVQKDTLSQYLKIVLISSFDPEELLYFLGNSSARFFQTSAPLVIISLIVFYKYKVKKSQN